MSGSDRQPGYAAQRAVRPHAARRGCTPQLAAASGELQRKRLLELLMAMRSTTAATSAEGSGEAQASGRARVSRDEAATELRSLLLARIARSGVPAQDAEDVLHDTLLQALVTPVDEWLHGTAILPTLARRRSVDRIRRLERERRRSAPAALALGRESA